MQAQAFGQLCSQSRDLNTLDLTSRTRPNYGVRATSFDRSPLAPLVAAMSPIGTKQRCTWVRSKHRQREGMHLLMKWVGFWVSA